MKDILVFVSPSRRAVALRDEIPAMDGDVLLSSDGETFHEATSPGFAGSAVDNKFTVKDPLDGTEHEARRRDDTLTFRGEVYRLDPAARVVRVVPLPNVRVAEYLFRVDAATLLYVSRAKYKSDYRDFKLFVGPADSLAELQCLNVRRYRDGGTTFVETTAGVLFAPVPSTGTRPTWRGAIVQELDPAEFSIEEVGRTARVRPR